MPKRWFMLAAIVILLLTAWVAATPWLAQQLIRRALAARPGIVVNNVEVGRRHLFFEDKIVLEDVRVLVRVRGKFLSVAAPRILIRGLGSSCFGPLHVVVRVDPVRLVYDAGEADALAGEFIVTSNGIAGPLRAAGVRWAKVRAAGVDGVLTAGPSGISVRDIHASAYGGSITGQAVFPATVPGVYTVEASVRGFDAARLGEIDSRWASRLDGPVTGRFKVSGDARSLREVDVTLAMPSGGKVSAALLSALSGYLPRSREKDLLDALVRKGGMLAIEDFSFTIKGGMRGNFAGRIHLSSRAVNLVLNLEHEINTDGTLASLAAYWQKQGGIW